MMPKMDGLAACAELRRLPGGDSVPILVITGYMTLLAGVGCKPP
jgi:CheY-like chemotaxis protein